MKKYLTLFICLLSFSIYSQQMGFNVVYVEAEPNSEDNIIEALDNYFGTKKFKPGGAVVLERLWIGGPKDMTHRLVFLWELGNQGFEEGEFNPIENQAFWGNIINRVESWGDGYAGRFINFVEGDVEKYPYAQIWDIIPEDPSAFAKAQTEFVESLPELFKDRFVGFGTYDINRPNGATHWALLSGTNLDDHLKFANDVQTTYSKKFKKYLEDRGAVELIHNFTFENKSFIK
tara:strand:+ start:273 stop:968 length:696 start_codon:yes stop_codon:yes gene_type:complete